MRTKICHIKPYSNNLVCLVKNALWVKISNSEHLHFLEIVSNKYRPRKYITFLITNPKNLSWFDLYSANPNQLKKNYLMSRIVHGHVGSSSEFWIMIEELFVPQMKKIYFWIVKTRKNMLVQLTVTKLTLH